MNRYVSKLVFLDCWFNFELMFNGMPIILQHQLLDGDILLVSWLFTKDKYSDKWETFCKILNLLKSDFASGTCQPKNIWSTAKMVIFRAVWFARGIPGARFD